MKIRIERKSLGVMLFGAAMFLIPSAQAAEPVWTHVAGACVVDKLSATPAMVLESELRFEPASIGEIVVRCNVVNPKDDGQAPLWRILEVVYRDPDGFALPNQVKVLLKRVTNAGTNFLVSTFDSNAFAGGAAPVMNSVPFVHVFNFTQNAYWVEIRLKRANVVNGPSAFLVRLRA